MRKIIFTLLITITQLMAVQTKALDANEIRAYILDDGGFGTHPTRGEGPGLYWPKSADESEGKALLYAAGLWVVGLQNGKLAGSAAIYSSDFRLGYVAGWDSLLNEPIQGDISEKVPSTERAVYRMYKIHRNPITGLAMKASDLGAGHPDEFDYDDWQTMINAGNERFPKNENKQPLLIGDQTLFVIYSDAAGPKEHSQIRNAGLEVHQLAWAFNTSGPLSRSMFVKWRIINMSPYDLTDTYVSVFQDSDIGGGGDDSMGANPSQGSIYSYNFGQNDTSYGDNPPALYTDFLQGPIVDGINPSTKSATDVIQRGNVRVTVSKDYILRNNEFIYKEDSYILALTNHFPYYRSALIDIRVANAIPTMHKQMQSLSSYGNPFIDPTTGKVTKIPLIGDPFKEEGWINPYSSDVRQLASSGPFTLLSMDNQEVLIGLVVGQGPKGKSKGAIDPHLISLQFAKFNDLVIKDIYRNDFKFFEEVEKEKFKIPEKFEIPQNYPNPFNPSTNISFSLEKASNVKITIFNSLGQKVKQLVDQQYSAGQHSVKWNGKNRKDQLVSAGVYFYQIEAGKLVRTRKMVLSK